MSVEVLSAVQNKIMSFEEKWMQLEIIALSKQSRSPKGKHHSAFPICSSWILYRFIESFMQIWQESGRETKDAEVVV